jgi:hypothetical protein
VARRFWQAACRALVFAILAGITLSLPLTRFKDISKRCEAILAENIRIGQFSPYLEKFRTGFETGDFRKIELDSRVAGSRFSLDCASDWYFRTRREDYWGHRIGYSIRGQQSNVKGMSGANIADRDFCARDGKNLSPHVGRHEAVPSDANGHPCPFFGDGHFIQLFHQVNLFGHDLFGADHQPYLEVADNEQAPGEYPRSPFKNVVPEALFIPGDENGWERYNGCLLLFICACLFASLLPGGYGLVYALDRRKRWGWLLFALALLMNGTAIVSGGLHSFPWDWEESWRQSQQSSHYHQTIQHDGGNVPRRQV